MSSCLDSLNACRMENPSDNVRPVRPLRILVVDDDLDTVESLVMVLRLSGHEVHPAHGGSAALAAARDLAPDVVLLDLGMPPPDGFEVARCLRQMGGPRKPLLIAVTGYGDDAHRRRCDEAGFDFHLLKPVDPEELCRLCAALKANVRC